VFYPWAVPLAAATADLLICTAVVSKVRHDRTCRAFAVMTVSIVLWNLGLFSLDFFPDAERAELWSRIFRVGMCFAPPASFHMALLGMQFDDRRWWKLLGLGYAVAAFLAGANLLGLLVTGVTRHTWGWYPDPTPLYRVFAATIVIFPSIAGWMLWERYRRPLSARQRVQAKLLMLSYAVQGPLLWTNLLSVYGYSIYPLGSLGNVFWVGVFAYTMARHRLMDLDYLVRKVLSFVLASAPVLVPGGLAISLLTETVGSEAPLVLPAAAVGLALISILLVPTLQEGLESRLHRALFPERYGSRQRLRELGKELVHILEPGELVKRLGDELVDILDVERCDVLRPDERSRLLIPSYPSLDKSLPLGEDATRWLEAVAEPVLVSELEAVQSPAAEIFRQRRWEAGIPLRINERSLGFVALGPNKDLRMFSAEDMKLLAAVSAGASVALDNARLSRQLRRSETILERANRLSSIGQLAAGIAHEIRNPLVAVKTFLDLFPERLDDREFLLRFRELSLTELGRVTHLIQDLLSFGKSTKSERRVVALAETLEPVVRLMETSARKRHVEVRFFFEPNLPPVLADPDQLKQIVINLILNAIEVSPPQLQVRLVVRASREFAGPGKSVTIEVHDKGPGIPKEHQEDIFLPFFTTKESGTGLGLALVHQMILEHGGEITVDSELGRGTTFRVVLPATGPVVTTGSVPLAATGT
jgi:signal transduction histidine kinase